MKGKLTPRQARFVEEYLVDLNATAAAIRAGYTAKYIGGTASTLLRNPDVAEAIERAKQKRAARLAVDGEYVINNLIEIVERTMQRAPVLNRQGNQVVDEEEKAVWQFNAKEANRALELLGKHLGLFREKAETEVSGGITITWEEK